MFRAGLDYLALELRPGIYVPIFVRINLRMIFFGTQVMRHSLPGVTDVQGLASRLLEVALLRVAKVTICH